MAEYTCEMCDKPLPDYEPQYCCSGHECGCHGMPTEPPICSDECWDAMLKRNAQPQGDKHQKGRKDACKHENGSGIMDGNGDGEFTCHECGHVQKIGRGLPVKQRDENGSHG